MKYEIIPTHQGYEIRKPDGKFRLYVSKVYNGKYSWVTDYTYAKKFSLKTAQKHVEILKATEKNKINKKLKKLLENGCTDSDIEGFIEENPNINGKEVWDLVYESNAPDCCKGCKHIQMTGLMPCKRCSRRIVTKDYYERR